MISAALVICAVVLGPRIAGTEVRLATLSFSAQGVQCPQCADHGIAVKLDLIHSPAQAPLPLICAEQSMRFQLKAQNYFQGPGHVTIGLTGATQHDDRPRLVGRGIVLGRTEQYPGNRGCANGARVQVESYWAHDLTIPGHYNPPYSSAQPLPAGRKGNELFPQSCSEQRLQDGTSYTVVVNVSCEQSIQYTISAGKSLVPGQSSGSVVDASQAWSQRPEVQLVPQGLRGWWIGQVMAPSQPTWRIDLTDVVIATRYRLAL